MAFMLSYKLDFSSCGIMSDFVKSSHIFTILTKAIVHIVIYFWDPNMKKFTLISPRSYGSGLPLAGVSSKQGTTLSPPQSLMDFSPLSQLTNHIIAGLNELRQCAAIGVSASVHRQLVVVMECVIHELCEYHRCVFYMLCVFERHACLYPYMHMIKITEYNEYNISV